MIVLDDIKDTILQCTQDDVTSANAYIVQMARRCGVKQDEIANSYFVQRLGVCYACYNRCLMQVGADPTAVFAGKGGGEEDIFSYKLKLYGDELKRLSDGMVAGDFTNKVSPAGKAGKNINLWRA